MPRPFDFDRFDRQIGRVQWLAALLVVLFSFSSLAVLGFLCWLLYYQVAAYFGVV